jgi:cytochrome P450
LEITSHPEVMALLQEENRYRSGAETLRKAAEELARMRLAAEAVRKAAEQDANQSAEDRKLTGIADLEMYAKKTAPNY